MDQVNMKNKYRFDQLITHSQVMIDRLNGMITYIDRILRIHAIGIATLKDVKRTMFFTQDFELNEFKRLFFPASDMVLNRYAGLIKHMFVYD
jgi:hypothetical protein